MPRRKRCRWVTVNPSATFFKPRGVPMVKLEQVMLELDEVEALRLADFEGRYHEEAAELMGVSRPTFGRIVESARRKVADALLHGKALLIARGNAVVYNCASTPCRAEPRLYGMKIKDNYFRKKNERSEVMKIAVTAQEEGLDAQIDPRFGRCAMFVIVDPETMAFESVRNDAVNFDSGAGISAAQTVVRLGVKAVITGSCGPKAFAVLRQAGIDVYTGASGTVREAIEDFQAGKLPSAIEPNAPGHQGRKGDL